MNFTVRKHIATAALLLVPLGAAFVAQPAAAAPAVHHRVAHVTHGRIVNMALDSNAGLAPGARLRVQVNATPGARVVNATLGHSGVRLRLHERAPGRYVGTHVIARGERIDPRGLIRVHAAWGKAPVAVAFNYPTSFQSLAMGGAPAAVKASIRS